jgi:hypothetical protein
MPAKKEKGMDGAEAVAPERSRAPRPADGNGASKASARPRRTAASGAGNLRRELREFASSHRQGWNHDGWTGLLNQLSEKGHDVSDAEGIGRQLEEERLALELEGVQGVGPAKIRKLAEEFGNLWALRHADADRIATAGGVKREVAERIQASLR